MTKSDDDLNVVAHFLRSTAFVIIVIFLVIMFLGPPVWWLFEKWAEYWGF